MRDLLPDSERIRLIHLADSRQIGAKRNYGCERAHGAVVCHWDDDDYSDAERLAEQVEVLVSEPQIKVTGYHSMRFTDGQNWWKYTGTLNYALGTSLCYWRSWWQTHRFPSVQVGEDNQFVAEAWAAGALHTEDARDRMHATVHPANTSPRAMGSSWKPIQAHDCVYSRAVTGGTIVFIDKP